MSNRAANNSGSQGAPSQNGGQTNGQTNGHASRGASPEQANELREYLRTTNSNDAPVLNGLIELISNGDEESVSRIISVIRTGASQAQILDTINHIRTRNGNGA
ncbi:hypothetical protein N7495_006188 [Penicillium taxi]|uniref:uncharacterized protein n=1 Tax=Penicillium taxi TaxID=168475 RepID=UPI00254553BA|nr:uncharacterized protein N7495_006188 [Penicillium taxi]KAJ5894497.1 hypothetical protein N7495_006188 [Penicillium taxi]